MPHAESPESSMEVDLPTAAPQTAEAPATEAAKANLEDLFDDDSDSDEFTSSLPQAPKPPVQTSSNGATDPETMRAFYQRLFPFRFLFQWLNHHAAIPTNDFANREFAFTLPNDAYLRYQSFKDADALRKQCMQQIPSRFEIGPVYSSNPRERKTLRKSAAFRPLSKELVFDIDLTDYDGIRTCCTGAKICKLCWRWIPMAIDVIDKALRADFGFKHILWVYSGRRGAHAWVCDKRARDLDDKKRRSIAGYLELLRGGDKSGKKFHSRKLLHPHIDRSYRVLINNFDADILDNQDPWLEDKPATELLTRLPDAGLRDALAKKWDSAPGRSSERKWADIKTVAETVLKHQKDAKAVVAARKEIVLEYTYPRLDAEVSKKLNHLLKSPFCVHPGTGRVCVPIDTRNLDDFDPFAVPTVTELLGQIDEYDRTHKKEDVDMEGTKLGEKKMADWEKTKLKPYVDYFRAFVSGLLKEERGFKREREEGDGMEF
ncbi:hypothetical protein BLS_001455 [Venturia inaequalis]|uniref:DNA primase n=1 Tax=Venturia inaequalis TaxID=5025 RepID=A0A8H3YJ99_VENIN|nr:hypothetical protein BLS_001455 [Venturia inaequalis]KAE9974243.1 hypothetical protein EG328_003962 [Venturia inaequalis]KAE9979894.1 hypothetical protein EG327_006864 [Venturia inaequalis]RDI81731.1 hypothetical protein Vi05172_g8166 [Venturia inaequalis]